MSITTVLFDLDGTLLPMDQDTFAAAYVRGLAKTAAPYGYEPNRFAKAIMEGTVAMVKNDGSKTNEAAFWDSLAANYGDEVKNHKHIFDDFYRTEFQQIKALCGFTPKAAELIRQVKERGFQTALATNPLFPSVATESRIRWAGLRAEDFACCTTYEYAHYCKPNLDYYREVLAQLQLSPEECLMVGNDVTEDMIAQQLGIRVFLLTDCLINKNHTDISHYPQGNFDDLFAYIDMLER